MRVLVDVRLTPTAGAARPLPQRERRHGLLPRAARPRRRSAATSCSTARWSRSSTGVPTFGALADRMHVGSARRAGALAEPQPGHAAGLRPAPPRRRGPHRPPAERAPRAARGARAARRALAGARGVRRRRDAAARRPRSSGWRASCRSGGPRPTRPAGASPDWLKFPHRAVGSYVVGGWRHETDSAARIGAVLVGEPTRGRARLPRPGRQRHRRQERPAAARGARARCAPTRSPFADEVPAGRRRSAPSGSGPRSSSTSPRWG